MTPFNNPLVSAGYQKARDGMSLIRPVQLEPGQVLYRFYDSSRARSPAEGAMTPMQSTLEIYQLCIPGIGGTGSIASLALKVLSADSL